MCDCNWTGELDGGGAGEAGGLRLELTSLSQIWRRAERCSGNLAQGERLLFVVRHFSLTASSRAKFESPFGLELGSNLKPLRPSLPYRQNRSFGGGSDSPGGSFEGP